MALPLAVLLALSLLLLVAIGLKCRAATAELARLSAYAAWVHSENARMAGQLGSMLAQLEAAEKRAAANLSERAP